MTRMMLYTFHGANRTGDGERPHLREAPAVMTGPVAVLGGLTVLGGLLNVPAAVHHVLPLGPVASLDRWLAPATTGVVAAAACRRSPRPRRRPRAPRRRSSARRWPSPRWASARPSRCSSRPRSRQGRVPGARVGVERTLRHAYYVDEALDRGVARPLGTFSRVVLWRGVDVGVIDGALVRGSGLGARGLAWLGSRGQTGRVGSYAWVVAVGAILVISAVALR
jgi:NADH-quinone oxidoreductase subunit L